MTSGPLRLTVGIGPYDHTRDLVTRTVGSDRVRLQITEGSPEQIFRAVEDEDRFDVAEFSLAKYVAWCDTGRATHLAIPVFPSRALRQSSIYVRADSDRDHARSLVGARIGVPEWVQTAGVWARGWLTDHGQVPLESVHWHQGGIDAPGRVETVRYRPPSGVSISPVPDRALDELLLDGHLDALITARPPASYAHGSSRRLLARWREAEVDYVTATGLFPIMHIVMVRSDVVGAYPWLVGELVELFERGRVRSVARMADPTVSHAPVPWLAQHLEESRAVFGEDPFAYGTSESNMLTLGTFLDHCRSQGIVGAGLTADALFAPASLGE